MRHRHRQGVLNAVNACVVFLLKCFGVVDRGIEVIFVVVAVAVVLLTVCLGGGSGIKIWLLFRRANRWSNVLTSSSTVLVPSPCCLFFLLYVRHFFGWIFGGM